MTRRLLTLLSLAFAMLLPNKSAAQCGQNYDTAVQNIVTNTKQLPHEKQRIVFAGSSTFRLWDDMAESFPEYEVVNAGIGGSCFDDLYRYKEALISGTEPDILVIYEGDNDIVHVENGLPRDASAIYKDATELMEWLRKNHPHLPVFFLSPKPSPSRWAYLPKYTAINKTLKTLSEEYYNYTFIDCWPVLTDINGQVDSSLFIADMLHLNDEGNGILGDLIAISLFTSSSNENYLNGFIDGWHLAAATADSANYFGAFLDDESIFQGTDGKEYWTAKEFREWAAQYFRGESAWTFEAFERHWYQEGNTLWFNERLDSPHMGKCRGVGVVIWTVAGPKIDHYSLSFEVPNALVKDLVALTAKE